MEITPDQVQEWRSHPVTEAYINELKESKKLLQEIPRYSPIDARGMTKTSDICALENAHLQGIIETFEEAIILANDLAGGDDETTS